MWMPVVLGWLVACGTESVDVSPVESVVAAWKTNPDVALQDIHAMRRQADQLMALDLLLAFDTPAIVEIAVFAAFQNFNAKFNGALRVEVNELCPIEIPGGRWDS